MRKELADSEKDRRRLESLLKVSQAEVSTLKSLPQLASQAESGSEKRQLACKINKLGGRQTVVLTIDLGIREVSVCDDGEQSNVCGTPKVVTSN